MQKMSQKIFIKFPKWKKYWKIEINFLENAQTIWNMLKMLKKFYKNVEKKIWKIWKIQKTFEKTQKNWSLKIIQIFLEKCKNLQNY